MKYLEILVNLRKIIRSINLESKRIEKQFGVSIPQLMSLQYLSEQQANKATASQLKQHLKLNASTMSGIISRLEQKALIARLANPEDRRATFITLTSKGEELLQDPPTTLQEKLTARLSKLSPERIDSLNEHIDLLVQIMDAEELDASPIMTTNEIGKQNAI
ncbi:MarR family winged helix-turn-helix transcriptional regulator [Lewinella sp. LCG006]|uniref:MarR family winged helix-turn-helix transcriptional regulator n=1 Tax=Lewinella sp. LCG006 TaxID=3231911 RepID=UPI0034611F6A